jgi:hypothetical protein
MTNTNASYRKTKTGEWVVVAPARQLKAGATIAVHTKAGAVKIETIVSVGKPFTANGTEMAYGYLAAAPKKRGRGLATGDVFGRACRDCGGDVQSWSDGVSLGLCHDCF